MEEHTEHQIKSITSSIGHLQSHILATPTSSPHIVCTNLGNAVTNSSQCNNDEASTTSSASLSHTRLTTILRLWGSRHRQLSPSPPEPRPPPQEEVLLSHLANCQHQRTLTKPQPRTGHITHRSRKSFHKIEKIIPCRPFAIMRVFRPRPNKPRIPSWRTTKRAASAVAPAC